MAKRILNVTDEQYETMKASGVLECGHFAWMPKHDITMVIDPSRCRSIKVARTEYVSVDRMRLTAAS